MEREPRMPKPRGTLDRFLLTRGELLGRLRTLRGGRAAEEVVLGEPSNGAQDDLQRATALARQLLERETLDGQHAAELIDASHDTRAAA